eukprot:scaffold155732_cov30-Prasinocladus_malaysianus.AAC.1
MRSSRMGIRRTGDGKASRWTSWPSEKQRGPRDFVATSLVVVMLLLQTSDRHTTSTTGVCWKQRHICVFGHKPKTNSLKRRTDGQEA